MHTAKKSWVGRSGFFLTQLNNFTSIKTKRFTWTTYLQYGIFSYTYIYLYYHGQTDNYVTWTWTDGTVVSERKLINVWLIEFNEEFKHAIKGQSEISTLRAIITGKILDNLRV